MRVRVKFSKYGVMKFIGHLDVMRYFQKAMRRAGIDIAYSEGMSPHMIMSFAQPLGVGLTSDGEYMDVELRTPIASDEAIRRLNEVGVGGNHGHRMETDPGGEGQQSDDAGSCSGL
ncbi:MAG: TIGR03936 family radical SAM-associated protein [Lachnospiraceae bacterium]